MKPVSNWKVYFVLVCIALAFLSAINTNQTVDLPEPEYARPTVIREYVDFRHYAIGMIVNDDQYMYILFHTEDNYVQVYDLDGNYQFTLSFYTYLNGAMSIAQSNGYVYMRDEHRNLYVFKRGEFVEFLPQTQAAEIEKTLDFFAFSDKFEVRGASVWRTDGESDVCVIQRPAISGLYQSQILGIFVACVMLILCTSIVIDRIKERKKHT